MGFPTEKIINFGTSVKLALINSGNTPVLHTITAEAAAIVGATTVSLSAETPVFLQHDTVLVFGSTRVRIQVPDSSSALSDGILIGSTATDVPCAPLTAALVDNATATTYQLYSLLGVTTASPTEQPQTEDTTNMQSGFGQEMEVVGMNRSISVNGIGVRGDRCVFEVLNPLLRTDTNARKNVWCEMVDSNGNVRRGLAKITDASGEGQVRATAKYSLTITFLGNNFQYTAGDAALFATP